MISQIEKTALIGFRPISEADLSFIFSTWLKGLRYGNSWYRLIDNKIYYAIYHKLIEAILSKPTVRVQVACLKDNPEVILGYSVFEGERLHWVHVKKAWRNIGIAKDIVPSNIKAVSHLTDIGKNIMLKKSLIFNPFTLI